MFRSVTAYLTPRTALICSYLHWFSPLFNSIPMSGTEAQGIWSSFSTLGRFPSPRTVKDPASILNWNIQSTWVPSFNWFKRVFGSGKASLSSSSPVSNIKLTAYQHKSTHTHTYTRTQTNWHTLGTTDLNYNRLVLIQGGSEKH